MHSHKAAQHPNKEIKGRRGFVAPYAFHGPMWIIGEQAPQLTIVGACRSIMGWMRFSNLDDNVAVLNPMAVL